MKAKFLYLLLVLATFVAAVVNETEFPRFLLSFELLFAVLMALWVRYMARKLKVSLVMTQKTIQQGGTVGAQVKVQNPTWFPVGRVHVELVMRDLSGWHSADRRPEKYFTVEAGADRRSTDCWQTEICPVHCGLIQIEIVDVRVFDYIGLCSVRLPGPFNGRYVSVLPQVHPLKFPFELSKAAGEEGWQAEVAAKPGSDTQEIFDNRFYQRGDTLRNIHWKLSAKADDLMIKEFSMPVDTAYHIWADCEAEEPVKVSAGQMDRFLEMTAALAGYCVEQKNPCEILWYSVLDETMHSSRVENEEELYCALEELLGVCPYSGSIQQNWNMSDRDEEILRVALDGNAYQGSHAIKVELERE